MANKTINEVTNVSNDAQNDDLLLMWSNERGLTVKIKNKDLHKHQQPKTLDTPIVIDGATKTTVESALQAIIRVLNTIGGAAGVAFKGTMAQYEVAKEIPEGEDGFIPSVSLVIIDDENAYVKGEERTNG